MCKACPFVFSFRAENIPGALRMRQEINISLKKFVIYTYILFWILFLYSGACIYLNLPQFIQVINKYICAWTSTFVFIYLFKNTYPKYSFIKYINKQFSKVSIIDFVYPMLIQVLIIFIAIAFVGYIDKKSGGNFSFIDSALVPQLIILNILYGPMGEEIGWRSYALNELQKRYSPLNASLIVGLLWGLWHFPLWYISGYKNMELLIYCLLFMINLILLSIFLTFFYNKNKNILIAVWIHFIFNILLQFVIINMLKLLLITSILYFISILVIIISNKDKMLRVKILN